MEKAILQTLAYADIFDCPLNIREIHKWLIGKKANLRQVEKTLKKLGLESRVKSQGGYYCLPGRQQIISKRKRKEKHSYIYIRKIKLIAQLLKTIPWVKLVGVSGGLAMDNTGKAEDIDLFVITSKDRLWISRLFILGLLNLTGQRRKRSHKRKEAAGKICPNTILEEDQLTQRKNLYLAHEVLQIRVLWQKDGIYSKYLLDNDWVFKYLPNWISAQSPGIRLPEWTHLRGEVSGVRHAHHLGGELYLGGVWLLDLMENVAKKFQLKLMVKPKGRERVLPGAVYFHPVDYQEKVLAEFKQRINLTKV